MTRRIATLVTLCALVVGLGGCVGFSIGASPVEVHHYHFKLIEPAPSGPGHLPLWAPEPLDKGTE